MNRYLSSPNEEYMEDLEDFVYNYSRIVLFIFFMNVESIHSTEISKLAIW